LSGFTAGCRIGWSPGCRSGCMAVFMAVFIGVGTSGFRAGAGGSGGRDTSPGLTGGEYCGMRAAGPRDSRGGLGSPSGHRAAAGRCMPGWAAGRATGWVFGAWLLMALSAGALAARPRGNGRPGRLGDYHLPLLWHRRGNRLGFRFGTYSSSGAYSGSGSGSYSGQARRLVPVPEHIPAGLRCRRCRLDSRGRPGRRFPPANHIHPGVDLGRPVGAALDKCDLQGFDLVILLPEGEHKDRVLVIGNSTMQPAMVIERVSFAIALIFFSTTSMRKIRRSVR
jgi:hypothetical protein